MTQEHWIDKLEKYCKDYDDEVYKNAKRYDREVGFEIDDDEDDEEFDDDE